MNIIDQIRSEVERLKETELTAYKQKRYGFSMGVSFARGRILSTLQEKSEKPEVSEDLEEEIERYIPTSLAVKFPTTDIETIKSDIRYIARHFAQWQKEQMMKEAVEGCICGGPCREDWWMETPLNVIPAGLHVKPGDNVKVIIIECGHDFE